MRTLQPVDRTSFGPEAVKVMRRAFDEAWTEIAGNFGSDPHLIQAAQLQLASAVLSVASDDSRDAGAIRNAAMQAMARRYETPPQRLLSANIARARELLLTSPVTESNSGKSREARTLRI